MCNCGSHKRSQRLLRSLSALAPSAASPVTAAMGCSLVQHVCCLVMSIGLGECLLAVLCVHNAGCASRATWRHGLIYHKRWRPMMGAAVWGCFMHSSERAGCIVRSVFCYGACEVCANRTCMICYMVTVAAVVSITCHVVIELAVCFHLTIKCKLPTPWPAISPGRYSARSPLVDNKGDRPGDPVGRGRLVYTCGCRAQHAPHWP